MNHTNLPPIELIETKSFDLIGKALICHWQIRDHEFLRMITDDEIKQRFAHHIAEVMIQQKLVEFTMSEDILSGISTYRARAFVLPDAQVKTLRLEKLI